jgi:hypothetical protein
MHSMEHSPWEANSSSASQEVPLILGDPKFIAVFAKAY